MNQSPLKSIDSFPGSAVKADGNVRRVAAGSRGGERSSSMKVLKKRPARSGFTLIEVMVAMVVIAIITIGVLSSLAYASRITRLTSNRLAAKNVAQGFIEILNADDFCNVNPPPGGIYDPCVVPRPPGVPNGYADIAVTDPNPVWLDEGIGIPCAIEFEFDGYGFLTSSSTVNSVTDSAADWEDDEWAGDTLFIVDGTGAGGFSTITGNDNDTLDLSGDPLLIAPDATSKYMINHGKTVTITTTWNYVGNDYSQSIETLIANRRDSDDYGF